MKTKSYLCSLILCVFSVLIIQQPLFGQDEEKEGTYIMVILKDGSRLIGKKLAITSESIIMESEATGKLNIHFSRITRYKEINSPTLAAGGWWKENRTYMRNFLGGSGYGLEKGQGYYQNLMLFINGVNYGFTDNFSMGFTTEFSIIFSGLGLNPGFLITPKFTFPVTDNLINLGVGGALAHVPGSDEFIDFGALYGVCTIGPKDKNFSVGLGFSVVEGTIDSSPTIILSGQYRIGNGLALVTENWVFPDFEVGVHTLGLRLIGEKVTWDFTFVGVRDDAFFDLAPFPFVGLVVPFGR